MLRALCCVVRCFRICVFVVCCVVHGLRLTVSDFAVFLCYGECACLRVVVLLLWWVSARLGCRCSEVFRIVF